MTLAKLHHLHTKSVDFIKEYPQEKIKYDIYLHPPAGVELNNKNGEMVLILLRNLYELKDASRTWFEHLIEDLEGMGFRATTSDSCIYKREKDMIVLYVDGCILISNSKDDEDLTFKQLQERKLKMTDEGTMEEYLGISNEQNKDGTFRTSQPRLIDRIIESILSMKGTRGAKVPAVSRTILTNYLNGNSRQEHWHYRSVIGILNYLVNCTHPELAFCVDPKHSHEHVVKRIVRYLLNISRSREGKTQGIAYKPDKRRVLKTS